MIVNPLTLTPVDTPKFLAVGALILGIAVFPSLFLLVCIVMRWTGTQRPPYFTFFWAFATLGCLCLSFATANSPLSVLAFFASVLVCPVCNIMNWLYWRPLKGLSLWHLWAQRAALLSTAFVFLLIIWAVLEPNTTPKHA